MRTKGAFEYKEEAEELICNLITDIPKTTGNITSEVKSKYYAKIHFYTIKRILNKLKSEGVIRGKSLGRISIWYK